MSIILIVGILLLIVSVLTKKQYRPYIGFAFVFLIMGFQSNVMGDYMSYMEDFLHIKAMGSSSAPSSAREPFHPFLMKLFSWGPWWLFVALTSLFQTMVLARFAKRYCNNKSLYLAAVFFFFSFNLMLLQMKAMRQGIAVEMIVLAFMLVDSKKEKIPITAIILVVLAYLTHNTSMVFLPFLFIFWFVIRRPQILEKFGNGFLFPWVILLSFIFISVIRETFLVDYLVYYSMSFGVEDLTYSSYLDGSNQNEYYLNNMSSMSLYYLIFYSILVFVLSKYYQTCNAKMRFITIISIWAIFGEMIFWQIGTLPRIMMYFSVFNIVVYPNVVNYLHNKYGNYYALVFVIVTIFFIAKLSLPWMTITSGGRFGTYKFIFM